MNTKETKVIQDIMEKSVPKVTLDVLRERTGYKSISGVSERLRGQSMKVDTFVKFLDALGYELIVQPKTTQPAEPGCYKVGEETREVFTDTGVCQLKTRLK